MSDDDLELFSFRLDEPSDATEGEVAVPSSAEPRDGPAPATTDEDGGPDVGVDAFAALAALAGLDTSDTSDDEDDEPGAFGPAAQDRLGDDTTAERTSTPPAAAASRPLHVDAPLDDDAPWTAAAIAGEDDHEDDEPVASLLGESFDRHEPVEDIAAAEDLLDQLLAEAAAADADAAPPPEPAADEAAGSPDPVTTAVDEPDARGPADDTDDFSIVEDDEDDGALAYSLLRRQEPEPPSGAAPQPEPAAAVDDDDPFDGPFTFSIEEDDEDARPGPDRGAAPPAATTAAPPRAGARTPPPTAQPHLTPGTDDDEPLDGPFTFTVDQDEDTAPPAEVAVPTAEERPAPAPHVGDDTVVDLVRVDDEADEGTAAEVDPWRVDEEDAAPQRPAEPARPLRAGWGTDDDGPARWELPDDADEPAAATSGAAAQPDELDDFADLFEPVAAAEPEAPAVPEPSTPADRTTPAGPDGLDHLDDLAMLFEQVSELDEDPLASAPPPRLEDAIQLDADAGPAEVDPEVARRATEGGFTAGDNGGRARRGRFRR